ncbi:MAG: hypothetical protein ABR592_07780 [Nitriliruptorales bacterium]
MRYEAPAIEDFGSIAEHTFMPPKLEKPGNTDNFPLEWHPGQGRGSAPS